VELSKIETSTHCGLLVEQKQQKLFAFHWK